MRGDADVDSVLMIASFPDSILEFRGALVHAWLRRGYRVRIAAPGLDHASTVAAELRRRGVQVHPIDLQRTGRNPLADLRACLQLWWLMRRARPQFVLAYTVKPVVYGLIAAWLARVPHRFALITGLGYAFQSEDTRSGTRHLVQWLYRIALSRARKVLFQNRDDLALFRARGVISDAMRTAVVDGSGIDLAAYPSMPAPEGPVRFLMIARLLGDKGVREYAAAAGRLRERWPHARFALAGWIDEGNPDSVSRSELEGWVAAGDVVYLGRLADVRPALADSSVYVLPSYREGMPRTVLEAMASGRAIVTTDVPGCRETVAPGENGMLVPPRDAIALAGAMQHFLENPGLADTMGRRSREIAERRFDVHRINDIMLQEMGMVPKGAQEHRDEVG